MDWSALTQTLARIPGREAILWAALAAMNYAFYKSSRGAVSSLQKENQRLVEEKRWLWEQLKVTVPKTGLDHYNQGEGKERK